MTEMDQNSESQPDPLIDVEVMSRDPSPASRRRSLVVLTCSLVVCAGLVGGAMVWGGGMETVSIDVRSGPESDQTASSTVVDSDVALSTAETAPGESSVPPTDSTDAGQPPTTSQSSCAAVEIVPNWEGQILYAGLIEQWVDEYRACHGTSPLEVVGEDGYLSFLYECAPDMESAGRVKEQSPAPGTRVTFPDTVRLVITFLQVCASTSTTSPATTIPVATSVAATTTTSTIVPPTEAP